MASSTPNDDWFQIAAAAQIRSERFERAELLNGRAAMIGFVVGVLTEALTGHGIVSQITFGVFGCNWIDRANGAERAFEITRSSPHWPSPSSDRSHFLGWNPWCCRRFAIKVMNRLWRDEDKYRPFTPRVPPARRWRVPDPRWSSEDLEEGRQGPRQARIVGSPLPPPQQLTRTSSLQQTKK